MDKQIEELANDLQEAWTAWSLSKDLKTPYAFLAEILAKKWQPKIPEGAVVVPDMADKDFFAVEKTEWDKMVQGAKDIIHEREDKARKKTAKKFAERVKMAFYYEFDELIPSIMADKIDEIAKEITEGNNGEG